MLDHQDALEALNHHGSLSEKLKTVHAALAQRFTFIDRVAVAIYDPKTDELKTFVHSSGESDPLSQYQARLSQVSSLQRIRESGKPRVINDLTIFAKGTHEHTHRIAEESYGASYTVPMYFNGDFFG
ncbi:MAG: phosphohydrolase, partial [Nitrosospira sp.]|nr:phosphohydrolase [Nitrosospira sp.]